MKGFVSLGTDFQSILFLPTILLKDKIFGGRAQKFQLVYICDKTNPSHKNWLRCVVKYIICGW